MSIRYPYQLHEDSKKFMMKNQFVLDREEKRVAAAEEKKMEGAAIKK